MIFSIISLLLIEHANCNDEVIVDNTTTDSLIFSMETDVKALSLCAKELKFLLDTRYVTYIGRAIYNYNVIIRSAKSSLDEFKAYGNIFTFSKRYINDLDTTISIIAIYRSKLRVISLEMQVHISERDVGIGKIKAGNTYYEASSDAVIIIEKHRARVAHLLQGFKDLQSLLIKYKN